MLALSIPVLALWLVADNSPASSGSATNPSAINQGYLQMYDRQFEVAHKTFADYERTRPDDPLAPASDAAAYLFGEFDRLHILQSEFFLHDENFVHAAKLVPDPAVRRAFDATLDRAQKLASGALATKPQDSNALFASIAILGLRADFDALIDKRYLSSLSAMKNSRITAEKLLMVDPTCYDAHLAVGVENYMLSLKAAPMRWFLQLAGAQTDRDQGIERLRITAEKGNYLKPYARLLLAVAALRARDRVEARRLLEELAQQFPHNPLYAEELARIR
ncbi:MAG TPA: hypothetical protein VN841_11830 [Bryobacteraceae bacterium]|nr:hypothetical protein [Bryobacteraceae bacterium]